MSEWCEHGIAFRCKDCRIEALEAKLKKIEAWRDKWGPTDICKYAIQMEALVELEALLEKDDE